MSQNDKKLAGEIGVEYLRLFVMDNNKPAIDLYIKNGLQKDDGIYDDEIMKWDLKSKP